VDPSPPPDGVNSLDQLRQTTTPLQMLMGGVARAGTVFRLGAAVRGRLPGQCADAGGRGDRRAVPVQLMIGSVTSADTLTIALQ